MAIAGAAFRLGVYVYESAELIDFAGPCGVFSIAAQYSPNLEVALVAETKSPVQVRTGITVVPEYSFDDAQGLHALMLPGGKGSRREMDNPRLHRFVRELPESVLLAAVCSGTLILGRMGLLDGIFATSRTQPNPSGFARTSILEELSKVAPRALLSTARVVDSGRIITAAGATAGLDLGLHLLRRAGYDETFVNEIARVMEYTPFITDVEDEKGRD